MLMLLNGVSVKLKKIDLMFFFYVSDVGINFKQY